MTRLQTQSGGAPASTESGGAGGGRVSPFPWSTLEHLSRSDVRSLHTFRRWARAHLDLSRVSEALGTLLGAPISARTRKIGPAAFAPPLAGAVAVVVEPADAAPGASATLEFEPALASCLVARALRRAQPVFLTAAEPSASVAGAVAAIVAAASRRACPAVPLRVRRASPDLGGSAAASGPDELALSLTVLVGDEAFAARILFSPLMLRATPSAEASAWGKRVLAGLGPTPLRIPMVACTEALPVAEVAALGPGDVLLLAGWPLVPGGEAGFRGPVLLSPPDGDVGVRADLVDGLHVMLRGQREALSTTEGTMTDESGQDALIDAIGDVPVVVRVEVGEAVMAAREWASLGAGDVVALGRRVGEQVILRIGGIPVARGELVDIDGEVGVRIVARFAEETTVG